MHDRSGFTLVELMVTVALLGGVMLGIMQLTSDQEASYQAIDQVSEAHQNGRVLEQLLERDARSAGFKAPKGAAACGVDADTGPDLLFLAAADTILPVDQLPLNLRAMTLGASVVGAGAGYQLAAGSQALPLDQLFVDTAAGGSDFAVGAGLILTDRNDPFGPVSCGVVTDVTGNTVTANLVASFGPVGAGPDVVAFPANAYQVIGGQLLRNGVLVASGVEDLQVSWFFDLDDDRIIDAGEFFGDGAAPDYDPASALIDGVVLRELRFNLVMATRSEDSRRAFQAGRRQATENRTAASTAGADGRRRRVHSATVRLRNGAA